MQGDAADWAARYANLAVKSNEEHARDPVPANATPFPFDGTWEKFEKEFKTRFGSVDEEAEARRKIMGMRQGKQKVAHYAQEFQDIGGRTGFSDADLMERFCNGLNSNIRLHMISIELGQGKAKSLAEAINRACTIELAIHSPTFAGGNFRSSDPNAMDIDATRTGGNGKTRDDFLLKMKGHCFGCGSPDHVKGNCSWKNEKGRYCGRTGHVERVCQDKYMGVEKGRGNRTRRGGGRAGQQVAATTPWSLFDEDPTPGPGPNTTIAASTSQTPPSNSNPDFSAFRDAIAEQNKILAAILQKQEDF